MTPFADRCVCGHTRREHSTRERCKCMVKGVACACKEFRHRPKVTNDVR